MKDDSAELLIGIIIFIILILFIVVIIAALYATEPITVTPNPDYQTGRFLAPCTATNCGGGLICDGVSFTCRLPAGSPCLDYTDCVTGLICSGRCTDGPTGGPGQFCPCNSGYLCVPDPSTGYTICLGAGKTPCQTGDECVSGICDNGLCLAGAPDGYFCKQDLNCNSGNCSFGRTGVTGYCQATGITTGTVGATCNDTPCAGFTGGIMGAPCLGTTEAPLECFCTTQGVAGVCITESQGILSTCSPFSACVHDLLVCYGTGATACTDSNQSCVCLFNYQNPNAPIDSTCITGMEAVGSVCLNSSGLGCSSDGMCASQNCGGASVMAFYEFTDSTLGLTGAAFPGAIDAAIAPAFSGPAFGPTVSPYKMFGTSDGLLDTIYLVDHVQGFLSLDYNVATKASSGWTQHFPLVQTSTTGTSTSQKTLIDVGYNGTTFLVAFNEILTDSGTGPTGNNDTVYTWDGTNFSLYNFQAGSGIPGTQYESGTNRPLRIDYLDISGPNALSAGNDVLIAGGTGTNSGSVFGLTGPGSGAVKYTLARIAGGAAGIAGAPMVNAVGPVQFYYNDIYNQFGTGTPVCGATAGNQDSPSACPSLNNIAFGGSFRSFTQSGPTPSIPNALQFSGSVAGIGLPLDPFGQLFYEVYDYSIYSPQDPNPVGMTGMTGMTFSNITVLASAYQGNVFLQNVVALSYQGATTILPYNVSATDRSVATANGFYILSRGSCA